MMTSKMRKEGFQCKGQGYFFDAENPTSFLCTFYTEEELLSSGHMGTGQVIALPEQTLSLSSQYFIPVYQVQNSLFNIWSVSHLKTQS